MTVSYKINPKLQSEKINPWPLFCIEVVGILKTGLNSFHKTQLFFFFRLGVGTAPGNASEPRRSSSVNRRIEYEKLSAPSISRSKVI